MNRWSVIEFYKKQKFDHTEDIRNMQHHGSLQWQKRTRGNVIQNTRRNTG